MVQWFLDLFNEGKNQNSMQFFLSFFCAFFGFMAGALGFIIYSTKLLLYPTIMCGNPPVATVADIPPNVTALCQTFIALAGGGTLAAVFYRPKAAPLAEAKPPGGPTG